MIQDIFPHVYHNEFSLQAPQKEDYILAYRGNDCLCKKAESGHVILPCVGDLGAEKLQYAFSIDQRAYYLHEGAELAPADGFDYVPTRTLRDFIPDEKLFACACGESLHRWYESNRFCGRCGTPMEKGTTERSMVCPNCRNTVYPKICPAVIVAITHGDRLLLTRYKGRPFKRYALVAGFNEIGESIEDTVHREVMEEVGLKVKNPRFYRSQPWVYTDSLLMGFFCDLDGSDSITRQESELDEALWLNRDEIGEDYSPISLTGEMITLFREGKEPK